MRTSQIQTGSVYRLREQKKTFTLGLCVGKAQLHATFELLDGTKVERRAAYVEPASESETRSFNISMNERDAAARTSRFVARAARPPNSATVLPRTLSGAELNDMLRQAVVEDSDGYGPFEQHVRLFFPADGSRATVVVRLGPKKVEGEGQELSDAEKRNYRLDITRVA